MSEKVKKDFRVWIVCEETGCYAIPSVCTHLGCTPRRLSAENKFKSHCHGSGFFKSGLNFEGPRPLDRFEIVMAEDGQLVVDKATTLRMASGAEPDKRHLNSVLKV